MPDMAGSSEPATGHSWAGQPGGTSVKPFKKGEKMLDGKRRREQRPRNSGGNNTGETKVRRNRRCSMVEHVSTAPCGAFVLSRRMLLKELWPIRTPHGSRGKEWDGKNVREKRYVLTVHTLPLPHVPLHSLEGVRGVWSQVKPGKGGRGGAEEVLRRC